MKIASSRNENPTNLQYKFLSQLVKNKAPVLIYMRNGIRLSGKITDFDNHAVILHNSTSQLVFLKSISTILPNNYNYEF